METNVHSIAKMHFHYLRNIAIIWRRLFKECKMINLKVLKAWLLKLSIKCCIVCAEKFWKKSQIQVSGHPNWQQISLF